MINAKPAADASTDPLTINNGRNDDRCNSIHRRINVNHKNWNPNAVISARRIICRYVNDGSDNKVKIAGGMNPNDILFTIMRNRKFIVQS